jgi:predicted metal-dependent HD superfamily phosphohydrolase
MQEHLPGIDDRKIVSAMGSTTDRIWRIWHFEESNSQWDDERFAARFTALIGRLGGVMSRANDAFLRLRAAWSADGRRYHDLEHLADCLRELDGARAEPSVADIAELALWYHDAVCEPLARDNEERSAALLCHDAAMLDLRQEHVAAAQCIRATAHLSARTSSSPAADLVVDADLAILGRDPLRFMEFEYAVAEEHAEIAHTTYLLARGRFLAGLVGLPSIFRTKHFGDRY